MEQSNQPEKYIDQYGNIYYLDSNGVPYYLDNQGKAYYLDRKEIPYYIDSEGYAYYLDKNGRPYYIDENGRPYYLDANGRPFYLHEQNYSNRQGRIKYIYDDDKPEKFRFALGGGYSYRLGETDGTSITSDLKNAFNIDADAQYFFNSMVGIGINANYVKGHTSYYDIGQSFLFVGPSVVFRSDIERFLFLYSAGLGAIFFNQSSNYYLYNNISKATFASLVLARGEYKFNKNISLGLKISYSYGSLDIPTTYYITNISASSFNISAFISFRAK